MGLWLTLLGHGSIHNVPTKHGTLARHLPRSAVPRTCAGVWIKSTDSPDLQEAFSQLAPSVHPPVPAPLWREQNSHPLRFPPSQLSQPNHFWDLLFSPRCSSRTYFIISDTAVHCSGETLADNLTHENVSKPQRFFLRQQMRRCLWMRVPTYPITGEGAVWVSSRW